MLPVRYQSAWVAQKATTRNAGLCCDGVLLICLLACLIGAVFSPPAAGAGDNAGILGGFSDDDRELPWQLEADEVAFDQQTQVYIAKGRVVIWKGDKKLTADYVRYDQITETAYAEGNVQLTFGSDLLTGKRIEFNLDTQLGTVEDGYLFLQQNNFHIWGDHIEKVGENSYQVDKATITTCDGEVPDWKITGEDVKVDLEGRGSAKNIVMYARNMPVLYSPYFYYPSRRERQSGFLVPEFGTSDRRGNEFNQPFYWAINDSSDATFYGYYMSKRGIRWGGEYRYVLGENTLGTIMADYLHDKQIDDGSPESADKWGYPDNGRDIDRTNKDRYWIRMSHRHQLPRGFRANLDLDIVSDQDYLRDFRDGYQGYYDTNQFFKKYFYRQLNDFNDPIRLNRLNLNRVWPRYSLNAEARWLDDTIKRNEGGFNPTLQRLPIVTFNASKQSLLQTPLFFGLDSNYNNFWREDGEKGQRLDVWPRVFWPVRLRDYVSIEPSLGLRETLYYTDDSRFDHRELIDTRLDINSEVYRIYNVGWKTADRIKHRLRPQIIHEFIPDVNQQTNPNFDAFDRIENRNRLIYSLTNTLTSRTARPVAVSRPDRREPDQADERESPVSFSYHDMLWLKLEQVYDFTRDDRPFSPIDARLRLAPGKYFSMDASALWSVYDTKFLSRNLAVSIWDRRGDRLFVEHRFSQANDELEILGNVKSIFASLDIRATDRLRLFGDYEYNFEEDERVQTALGFLYQAACWSFRFRVIDRADNLNYEFRIELTGLGGIGN